MTEIFYDKDADLSIIQGKKVAVDRLRLAGPRPRAQNLRDSGVEVVSRAQGRLEVPRQGGGGRLRGARRSPTPPSGPTSSSSSRPTSTSAASSPSRIKDNLEPPGKTLAFGARLQHPLRLHRPRPRASTSIMVAPKGPGHTVRREYVRPAAVCR